MSTDLYHIKKMSEAMNPGDLEKAFEIFRLAVEKNKSGIQARQRKIKKRVSELDQRFKIFKTSKP